METILMLISYLTTIGTDGAIGAFLTHNTILVGIVLGLLKLKAKIDPKVGDSTILTMLQQTVYKNKETK